MDKKKHRKHKDVRPRGALGNAKATIQPTAIIGKNALIGSGTRVWAFAQVGDNARIGKNCVLGNSCYVDRTAIIGDNVKIMNKAQVFRGCEIGNNVFIGPGAIMSNDKNPRAEKTRQLDGIKWRIGDNSSIGANSTVLPDINIGDYAMVGAGSVVTKDVPKNGLVFGNPARLRGFVCVCGEKLLLEKKSQETWLFSCGNCGKKIEIPESECSKIEE